MLITYWYQESLQIKMFPEVKSRTISSWIWAFAAMIAVIPVVAFLETVQEGPVHHRRSADPGSPCSDRSGQNKHRPVGQEVARPFTGGAVLDWNGPTPNCDHTELRSQRT